MKEDTIKINYELTSQDYIEFNLYSLIYSKSMKKLMFVQRYIIPLFYFTLPFILDDQTNVPFGYWVIFCAAMYAIWVWTSPNRVKRNVTKKVLKSLKNEKFAKLLGEHTMVVSKEGIEDSGKGGEAKAPWSSILSIIEAKEHLYIFISESKAFIIPNRAFKKDYERQKFVERLKEFKSI